MFINKHSVSEKYIKNLFMDSFVFLFPFIIHHLCIFLMKYTAANLLLSRSDERGSPLIVCYLMTFGLVTITFNRGGTQGLELSTE